MISTTVIDEIRRMLSEGHLSQRKIASQIGVSRGTVNAIALGRRMGQTGRGPQENDGFIPPAGAAIRCNGCGAKVQMPCLVCYIRNRDQRQAGEPSPC